VSGGFDTQACIPLAKYDQRFLDRAQKEIKQLPQGSAIEEMLSDYAVLRAQNNRC
jgi:hypothetical protein